MIYKDVSLQFLYKISLEQIVYLYIMAKWNFPDFYVLLYTVMFQSVFRGGRICLTDHFKPLWAKNVPKFGIAHAMSLGVSNKIQHVFIYVFINCYICLL